MSLRTAGGFLVAWLAVFLEAGCAAAPPVASGADDQISGLIEQARAEGLPDDSPTIQRLADGVVTLEEYNQGVADQVSCLQEHGYTVTRQYVNKLDSWRIIVESEPVDANAIGNDAWSTQCSVEFVKYLELGYDLSSTNRIDARLLADARPCLAELNPAPEGTETSVSELVAATANHSGVIDCLWVSLQKLYPGEGMVETR